MWNRFRVGNIDLCRESKGATTFCHLIQFWSILAKKNLICLFLQNEVKENCHHKDYRETALTKKEVFFKKVFGSTLCFDLEKGRWPRSIISHTYCYYMYLGTNYKNVDGCWDTGKSNLNGKLKLISFFV